MGQPAEKQAPGNRILSIEILNQALRNHWKPEDGQLELKRTLDNKTMEIRSSRVFLDASASQTVLAAATNSVGLFSYFVNELRIGDRTTPYSIVTASAPSPGNPLVPVEMREDEIILNQWIADDLNAKTGDSVEMTYYVLGLGRQLEERKAVFRVRSIIPITGAAADRDLMPDFPGLAKADHCRDWDTGFAIKTDKIRLKDEQYWNQYKGTPQGLYIIGGGDKSYGPTVSAI